MSLMCCVLTIFLYSYFNFFLLKHTGPCRACESFSNTILRNLIPEVNFWQKNDEQPDFLSWTIRSIRIPIEPHQNLSNILFKLSLYR